jgi:aminoglycoside phosphotransferase (APT) family kinase protein
MTYRPEDTPIGLDLVRSLLAVHFPRWAELPITEFQPAGTQNAVFRLGGELCVRLPRRPRAAARLEKELRWLPIIGRHCSVLEIPTPVAMVGPTTLFGMPWAIYQWIEGNHFTLEQSLDNREAAQRLASFLSALRRIDPAGAPLSQLNMSHDTRDREVRSAMAQLGNVIDQRLATAVWERSLSELKTAGTMVWTHGDLLATNLLLRHGRLAGMIDFGYAGVGDPAFDLLPAWSVFDAEGREAFRQALDPDDSTWLRGRVFALHTMLTIAAAQLHRGRSVGAIDVHMIEALLSDCS